MVCNALQAKPTAGEEEVRYCVCNRVDDGSLQFVQCDDCEEWFHPECVGTTFQVRLHRRSCALHLQ